jgi:Fe-Mn family superoxide dismutase
MADFTRRSAIGAASLGAAGLTVSATGAAAAQVAPALVPAFAGNHQPKPLKFDPAKLPGLSEKLITSHWQNNYQGSVKGLNTVEHKLAEAMADRDFAPLI